MVKNFQANKATCPDGHEYLVNHQSAECPHERFVDLMVNKPDRLIPLTPEAEKAHQEFVKRCTENLARLLTNEEIERAIAGLKDKGIVYCCQVITGYQDLKTASIKDAEHAQRYKEWEEATMKAEQAIIAHYKAEHQQKVREIFEYECKDCSTPGFRHLVIPEKVASRILGGK